MNHPVDDELVDYTSDFEGCIAAHAKGRNVLILRSIDPVEASRLRFDGKRAIYHVEYRFLSRDARPDTDDYVCVESGPENTFWQAKEVPSRHKAVKSNELTNLFDHLNCF